MSAAVNGTAAGVKCERCGGGVLATNGLNDNRPVWYCPKCNSSQPREQKGVTAASMTVLAAEEPVQEKLFWDKAARRRLESLITALEKAADLRSEAERIHAALTAFGMADLPGLPWRDAQGEAVNSTGSRRVLSGLRASDVPTYARPQYQTPACVECGYEFVEPRERVTQRRGSVCRSDRRCAERKATPAEG